MPRQMRMSAMPSVEALAGFPLFDRFERAQRAGVAGTAREVAFDAGEPLVRRGRAGRSAAG